MAERERSLRVEGSAVLGSYGACQRIPLEYRLNIVQLNDLSPLLLWMVL